jgi:hypothetical protein
VAKGSTLNISSSASVWPSFDVIIVQYRPLL